MTVVKRDAVMAMLEALPQRLRGPGGVAGIVHDGEIVAARAWGHADLANRRVMTRDSRLPLCSISKQFTCMTMMGAVGAPEALDEGLPALLPNFESLMPSVRELCNNQSGLRDYWALTVLQGAKAEQYFPREAAAPVFARMKTGHFAPGTRYSYSNGNFRLVADLLEAATGRSLAALTAEHIFGPAGMARAEYASDTRSPSDGVVGYEGNDATGYLPAENGVWWMGDAGIAASLDDMLAYERWIDATRDDPASLYQQIALPQTFRGGGLASYGFGLQRITLGGVEFTGHGGALRGYRAFRLYSKAARLSVVVMLNHHGDAHGGAQRLARAALGLEEPLPPLTKADWDGQWLCAETGLLARLETQRRGVTMRYGTSAELLGEAGSALVAGQIRISREGADLQMQRGAENLASRLTPVPVAAQADAREIAGRYFSPELEAQLSIEARDGGVHAVFEGHLGQSRPEIMHAAGPDFWIISTRRSLDAPAPGDWTLQIERDSQGRIRGARLGCWLARGIDYLRH